MGNSSHLSSSPEHDEKRLLILKENSMCDCAYCNIKAKDPDLVSLAVADIFHSIVENLQDIGSNEVI